MTLYWRRLDIVQ